MVASLPWAPRLLVCALWPFVLLPDSCGGSQEREAGLVEIAKHAADEARLAGSRSETAVRQCRVSDCTYAAAYPKQYVAHKTSALAPDTLDGNLNKTVWTQVPWTEDFVDISTKTIPKLRTRAKMRWDDDFLYVAAELEEPDVWATLTEHNSVIFQDNDFEVFVDANGTTHHYKEFEINAFGTTWDLSLDKPYGDGGSENSSRVFGPHGWDMQPPLRSAVAVSPAGVINDPSTPNKQWSVEIALPLRELAYNNTPNMPVHGTFWRLGFSRVQWNVLKNATSNTYQKDPSCQSCPEPGAPHEDNWVWSPQGEIAMHLPERWGILEFSAGPVNETAAHFYAQWPSRSAAMAIYYAEHAYKKEHGSFTSDLSELLPYSAAPFEICDCAETKIEIGKEDGKAGASFLATVVPPAGAGAAYAATVGNDRFLTVAAAVLAEAV